MIINKLSKDFIYLCSCFFFNDFIFLAFSKNIFKKNAVRQGKRLSLLMRTVYGALFAPTMGQIFGEVFFSAVDSKFKRIIYVSDFVVVVAVLEFLFVLGWFSLFRCERSFENLS